MAGCLERAEAAQISQCLLGPCELLMGGTFWRDRRLSRRARVWQRRVVGGDQGLVSSMKVLDECLGTSKSGDDLVEGPFDLLVQRFGKYSGSSSIFCAGEVKALRILQV